MTGRICRECKYMVSYFWPGTAQSMHGRNMGKELIGWCSQCCQVQTTVALP